MGIYLDDERMLALEDENKTTFFYSRFEFLKSHYGIRPGELHFLIGTSGSGKSTLLKTIIIDAAQSKRVTVFLSEENPERYAYLMNKITRDKDVLNRIDIVSQLDMPKEYSTPQQYRDYFEAFVFNQAPELIFFDNLTTSDLFTDSAHVAVQSANFKWLKHLTESLNVPIFCVCHTTKDVTNNMKRLITLEDTRGSSEKVNYVAYGYAMQMFIVNGQKYGTITVSKHRNHNINSRYYLLGWDNNHYAHDKKIPFDVMKKLNQEADRF